MFMFVYVCFLGYSSAYCQRCDRFFSCECVIVCLFFYCIFFFLIFVSDAFCLVHLVWLREALRNATKQCYMRHDQEIKESANTWQVVALGIKNFKLC